MLARTALASALTIGLTVVVLAQAGIPEKKPSFEVASIKPNRGTGGGGWSSSGGRQTIINTTASILVGYAFDLNQYEIVGAPAWLERERLDVIVQAEPTPTESDARLMMQSLLEERFAMKAHLETREAPTYRAVRARSDGVLGPALVKSTVECGASGRAIPCGMRVGGSQMQMGRQTIRYLLDYLESAVGRRITDETGLTGEFDITLEWSRGTNDTERPSIFTAVQEQLGLKLEQSRGPVNMLIIDSISRPTPD
jgi:uncharacterized protein (TIGR03435 family)